MDKNFTQTSNLIDITEDNINLNRDDYLVSSDRNNNTERSNAKKEKKVKFFEKVIYIDVECWKKYNEELTAEENFDDIEKEDENNDNVIMEKNDKNNKKNRKKDNIACTCILI